MQINDALVQVTPLVPGVPNKHVQSRMLDQNVAMWQGDDSDWQFSSSQLHLQIRQGNHGHERKRPRKDFGTVWGGRLSAAGHQDELGDDRAIA